MIFSHAELYAAIHRPLLWEYGIHSTVHYAYHHDSIMIVIRVDAQAASIFHLRGAKDRRVLASHHGDH